MQIFENLKVHINSLSLHTLDGLALLEKGLEHGGFYVLIIGDCQAVYIQYSALRLAINTS